MKSFAAAGSRGLYALTCNAKTHFPKDISSKQNDTAAAGAFERQPHGHPYHPECDLSTALVDSLGIRQKQRRTSAIWRIRSHRGPHSRGLYLEILCHRTPSASRLQAAYTCSRANVGCREEPFSPVSDPLDNTEAHLTR